MIIANHPNIEILEKAASFLRPLINELVFIGGCATGLLITDPAAAPIRTTIDVDVLAEVSTLVNYHALSEKIRTCGFAEDLRPEAPICRWNQENVILDIMPTNPKILGFGNQWYAAAFAASMWIDLPSGDKIQILPAPYFLAIKFEAFDGRGCGDYLMSRDIQDIISIFDGRAEIVEEINKTGFQLRGYLNHRLKLLLKNRLFIDALPGHLPPDSISQSRADLIIERMEAAIKIGDSH